MHQTGDWDERTISNKSFNLPQATLHTSKAQVEHILMYLLISSTSHCKGKAACEHFLAITCRCTVLSKSPLFFGEDHVKDSIAFAMEDQNIVVLHMYLELC